MKSKIVNLVLLGGLVYVAYQALRHKGVTADPDVLGDVDGDGIVTEDDAKLVARYVTGQIVLTDEQLRRADVNKDGVVTIVDALFISQMAKGLRK